MKMEQRIKEFIEEFISIKQEGFGKIEIEDGEMRSYSFEKSNILGYYCDFCHKEVEITLLIDHVKEHLAYREYFVYVKNTYRVFAKTEEEAIKRIANEEEISDDFELEAEQTNEDRQCAGCGSWYNECELDERGTGSFYCGTCIEKDYERRGK